MEFSLSKVNIIITIYDAILTEKERLNKLFSPSIDNLVNELSQRLNKVDFKTIYPSEYKNIQKRLGEDQCSKPIGIQDGKDLLQLTYKRINYCKAELKSFKELKETKEHKEREKECLKTLKEELANRDVFKASINLHKIYIELEYGNEIINKEESDLIVEDLKYIIHK